MANQFIYLAKCVGITSALLVSACASTPFYETPPNTPVNMTPAESTNIMINSTTRFVWQAVDDVEFYEFHIFNRANRDINQYYRRDLKPTDVCENGQCQLEISVALPFMEGHAWRVRAGNIAGWSEWNRTMFTMVGSVNSQPSNATSQPPVPMPLQPVGVQVKNQSLVDFLWEPVPNATSYDFHIFDASTSDIVESINDLPAATVCQGVSQCQLTRAINLLPADNHAWRVRAVNDQGRSEWSRETFTVTN